VRDLDCAPHSGQKVGSRLSTVTVKACSRRSTLTTFMPATGDHVIDIFITSCCRIPSQRASRPASSGASHPASACTKSQSDPHGMMRRDCGNLVAPIVSIGEAAVEENHRRTLAVDSIVNLDPVGFGFAAAIRSDWRRGRREGLPSLRGERRQRYAGDERGEGERAHEASPGLGPGELFAFPVFMQAHDQLVRKDALMTGRRSRYGDRGPA
jgi:hypothetical protein